MAHNSLHGVNREAVFVILKDSRLRVNVLQHMAQTIHETGEIIDGRLSNDFVLPRLTTKPFSFIEEHRDNKSSIKNSKSRVSTFTFGGVRFGECGRFEREMCEILDSIELARAEITGVQAIQLPNGRIQYINEKQIKDRKCKEDLEIVSNCLTQIITEIEENGTFDTVKDYVLEKTKSQSDMEVLSTSDKVTESEIHFMGDQVGDSHQQHKKSFGELKVLVEHLRHQKQELIQKNKMECNLATAKTNSDIEELKMSLQSIEKEIFDEMTMIQSSINRENRANMELSMYLRNTIQVLEQNIDYWTNVHSVETAKAQGMLKELTKQFQALKHKLETLVVKYVNYEKVCIEDRLAKAEQAKLDEITALYNSKALIIQKWWRFICAMLSIGPHAPKKKGKKGKDKKKKK